MSAKRTKTARPKTDVRLSAALNELRVTQGALTVLVEELTLMRSESILHRRALTELGVLFPELIKATRELHRSTGDLDRGIWSLTGRLFDQKLPVEPVAVTVEHLTHRSCPTCDRVDIYSGSGELIDSTDWHSEDSTPIEPSAEAA